MKFRVKVDKVSSKSGKKLGSFNLKVDAKNKTQAFNMIKSFNKKFSRKTRLKLISISKSPN